MKYKRIMMKVSGEGLRGDDDYGISTDVVDGIAKQIKAVHDKGVDVCLVVGGGNIYRGAGKSIDAPVAHQLGMLATVFNGVYLKEALKKQGLDARVVSSIDVPKVCESYIYGKALSYLERRRVVIFVGGTGNAFFSTDTAAVLRATEMKCDVVFKATQVDGVYDSDPKKNRDAKRFDRLSFDEAINKNLKVMDMTAFALARENNLPIVVFAQGGKNSIADVVQEKGKFTIVE